MKCWFIAFFVLISLTACQNLISSRFSSPENVTRPKPDHSAFWDSINKQGFVIRDSIPIVARNPYFTPSKIKFKFNGTCIFTSSWPGSDSGAIHFQQKGKYTKEGDQIEVTFDEYKSIGQLGLRNNQTLKDREWKDINSRIANYIISDKKDTIWVVDYSGQLHLSFLKD